MAHCCVCFCTVCVPKFGQKYVDTTCLNHFNSCVNRTTTPVHKVRFIKTRFSKFGVDELNWPAQSPPRPFSPIQHFWDELEL